MGVLLPLAGLPAAICRQALLIRALEKLRLAWHVVRVCPEKQAEKAAVPRAGGPR